MILISACLLGYPCKYSGKSNFHAELNRMLEAEIILPVCPECAGGLPTPRLPSEISGGNARDVLARKAKILDNEGNDRTSAFVRGAYHTLRIAQNAHVEYAILKKNSPSCGSGTVYDGSFQGKLTAGNGVTAELLLQNGIPVFHEEDYIMGGRNCESN